MVQALKIDTKLFDQFDSGVVVCVNNQISYLNAAALYWFQTKPTIPGPCREVFSHLFHGIGDALIGVQTSHGMNATLHIQFTRSAQSDSAVRVDISRMDDEKGTSRLFVFTDETKARLIQDNLIQASRDARLAAQAKSDFLATMSHEIRTPLNSIIGFTEILLEDPHLKPTLNYLDAIRKNGESLLQLVNDMLDYSRIDSGMLQIKPEPVSIAELVKEIKMVHQLRAGEKDVRWEVSVPDSLPRYLVVDKYRVSQIINNLVSNAIKFTSHGKVTLDVTFDRLKNPLAGCLVFKVTDSGIGIPKEFHDTIFDVFSQVQSDSRRSYEGSGLGLSITRKLVSLMNGTIDLWSEPGQGSRFTVTFPDTEVFEADQEEVSGADEPSGIQIVDDPCFNLSEKVVELLARVRNRYLMSDVERLANELKNMDSGHTSPVLSLLARDLEVAADSFDIEKVECLIKKIADLNKK